MAETVYPVPEEWAKNALIDAAGYQAHYDQSINDPDAFWRREAQRIDWIKPFSRVNESSFDEADFRRGSITAACSGIILRSPNRRCGSGPAGESGEPGRSA